MSQDRILGSSASIEIYGPNGPIPFGEIDEFSSEPDHELKNFHPLGQVEQHSQIIYKGYKLTFKGGKVNGDWDSIQEAIDTALLNGQPAPRYRVTQTTIWFNGNVDTWVYDNALIYNLKIDDKNSEDQIDQDFSGWAPRRVRG